MRHRPRLTLLALLAAIGCAPPVAFAQSCKAPDRVTDATEYNTLVCDAERLMQAGEFTRATSLLARASELNLHEYPNFRALPRLALAYANAGRLGDAMRTLQEAELSFEIFFGISRCVSSGDAFRIARPGGQVADPSVAEATIARMCGEAFEGIYEQASINALLLDLPLLDILRDAREVVGRSG